MILTGESDSLEDYLAESEEVDFNHLSIKEKAAELFSASSNEEEFIRRAYTFVRDEIAHSWDIQSTRITCKASEVLYSRKAFVTPSLICCALFYGAK